MRQKLGRKSRITIGLALKNQSSEMNGLILEIIDLDKVSKTGSLSMNGATAISQKQFFFAIKVFNSMNSGISLIFGSYLGLYLQLLIRFLKLRLNTCSNSGSLTPSIASAIKGGKISARKDFFQRELLKKAKALASVFCTFNWAKKQEKNLVERFCYWSGSFFQYSKKAQPSSRTVFSMHSLNFRCCSFSLKQNLRCFEMRRIQQELISRVSSNLLNSAFCSGPRVLLRFALSSGIPDWI